MPGPDHAQSQHCHHRPWLGNHGRMGPSRRHVSFFYEINPACRRTRQHWFTYLKDSHAKIEIALGDDPHPDGARATIRIWAPIST